MSDALIPWLPLAPLGVGALGLLRAFLGARLVAGIGRRISTRRAKRRGEGVAPQTTCKKKNDGTNDSPDK